MEKTFEITECIWGDEMEKNKKYGRQKNWYYYRLNQYIFDAGAGQFTETPAAVIKVFMSITAIHPYTNLKSHLQQFCLWKKKLRFFDLTFLRANVSACPILFYIP